MPDTPPPHEVENAMLQADGFRSIEGVAWRLRVLADVIERGSIVLENGTIYLPDEVHYKLELEEEHGGELGAVNFELEVELTWPTVVTPPGADSKMAGVYPETETAETRAGLIEAATTEARVVEAVEHGQPSQDGAARH